MRSVIYGFMFVLSTFVQQCIASANFVLVEKSIPKAVIVIPENGVDDEQLAAEELQEYIEKISGARIEIVTDVDTEFKPVHIGRSFLEASGFDVDKLGSDRSAFVINITDDAIYLAGNSAEGTLFSVYEFIEDLGVRWFWPGELGTVFPETKSISVPKGVDIQKPSFPNRHLQGVLQDMPWYRHQKFGGDYFMGQHGINLLPAADYEKDVELFAMVDGKRVAGRHRQLCISNPEVLKRAVAYTEKFLEENPDVPHFGMGPEDGGGFCECDNCKTLDSGQWDLMSDEYSMTDRYIWFFNKVLDQINVKWPEKKLAFYIYHTYMLPPVKYVPNKNITGSFATITLCRIHGASNPVCPDRSFYIKLMSQWGQLLPELWERGYYFNVASPPFPFSKVHVLQDEMKLAHQNNIKGWRVESMPSWVSNGFTLYVAGKLMWNVDADVDAIVNDYYDKFFGPASEPMGKWFDLMDSCYKETDCHVGGSIGMPEFFPPDKIKLAKKYFKQAEKMARGKRPFDERVRVCRLNFQMLDDYLNMWYSRNDHDFEKAYKYYNACEDKIEQLGMYFLRPDDNIPVDIMENKYRGILQHLKYAPLLSKPSISYLERFNYETIKSGYENTCTKGRLVTAIGDKWDFLIDTKNIGELVNWQSDKYHGGNWQSISINENWSQNGLHYYKGVAWYKTQFEVPVKFKGKKLLLWFGAVDELAKVWINGQLLGESFSKSPELPGHPMAFKPFGFDITDYVKFDQPNTIAVKITNNILNELGTGGVMAPVMIYTPN